MYTIRCAHLARGLGKETYKEAVTPQKKTMQGCSKGGHKGLETNLTEENVLFFRPPISQIGY